MTALAPTVDLPLATYLLRHGDDSLVLCQRLCEWVALAPRIEDDVALLNLALDHLGHARELLSLAGGLDGTGRTEDELAYERNEHQFVNAQLFEVPNGDFGQTIAKVLCAALWHTAVYDAWTRSTDARLADLGTRAARDCRFHLDYARTWAERLAGGTDESRRRLSEGLTAVLPSVPELFATDDVVATLVARGAVPDPETLAATWLASARAVLAPLGLPVPERLTPAAAPGRAGEHLERFGPMLAEMQHLRRSSPGGSW